MLTKFFILIFLTITIPFASYASKNICSNLFITNQDKYTDFESLKQIEAEEIDFRIREVFNNSPITIIAPHAGRIEFGTSEIATAISDGLFNLYLFEGIKESNNFDLHITSHHFEEPRAIRLMKLSTYAISIHGFKEDNSEIISIGGSNLALGNELANALKKLSLQIEHPSKRFPGTSPQNIVNRAIKGGVQIEISSKLRKALLSDPKKLAEFATVIRELNFDLKK